MELETAESQKDFVAPNTVSMAQAYATLAGGRFVQCFGIYDGDAPVGFVPNGEKDSALEDAEDVAVLPLK